MRSLQITISGKVQNVGFRFHTQKKASELGINGFVKNLNSGNVYIEAEAEENSLNQFIAWCYHGPDWARVIDVQICEQPVCNFKGFEIRR